MAIAAWAPCQSAQGSELLRFPSLRKIIRHLKEYFGGEATAREDYRFLCYDFYCVQPTTGYLLSFSVQAFFFMLQLP